jgi:hypothetical protein
MADKLTVQNGKAVLVTDEGKTIEMNEAKLMEMLQQEGRPPLNGTAFPDGFKFYEWRDPFFLVVHQLPPHVRLVRWIANDSPQQFGPGTTYRKVRLSLPYAVTFALYYQRGDGLFLAGNNELYFRNEPLLSKNNKLGYPALLNVSRIPSGKRERSWICTQYLQCPRTTDWTDQLRALMEHTWNGGFNLSSEHHEGASWYGESKGIHPDLHPIERWEQATAANEAFALGVSWKPVPMCVGELMDCILEENRQGLAGTFGRLMRSKQPGSLISRFLNFAARSKDK